MAPNEVNVQVAIRCRPLIGIGEQLEGPAEFVQCLKEQKKVIVDDKMFTFDYVFDSTDGQQEIYEMSVTPIVEKFLQGKNAAVVAYGQTGSGKTFTMGTKEEYNFSETELTTTENMQDRGIIPRVLKHIFENVASLKPSDVNKNNSADEGLPVITVSFLEVYNEEVYDILNPSRPKIQIRENAHIVKLPDIKEVAVSSYEEAVKCLSDGAQIRTTGATATNAHSSRSHAIFSVQLDQVIGGRYVQNRMMLVDLAGSEAVKKTKTQGPRFKEGININRGLLALGNVIRALSKDKGRSYVPYRDSTLSRLLQTCLQGNSNTLIIACINQVENNFLETTSTLQFAINARAVKIKLMAGDLESRTPCRWRKPYSSFITPTTVGRSQLRKMHDRSATKMPMNSTMLQATGIIASENHVKDLSVNFEASPRSVHTGLNFSPMPTLDESPIEPLFKKPRTPPQTMQRPAAGFTPYVERICSSFENCVSKLLANRLPASAQLDTPTRHSLVDSIAQQTMNVLQDCTNVAHQVSERSIFDSLDNTVITTSPNRGNTKRKRETTSSLSKETDEKYSLSMASISARKSPRRQTMAFENRALKNESILQQSVIMSPRRTLESHTAQILNVINRANIKQLQLLPHIGPKSALIIYNWRIQNGPLKDILDIKNVPGLPRTFMRNFATKNSLVDLIEEETSNL